MNMDDERYLEACKVFKIVKKQKQSISLCGTTENILGVGKTILLRSHPEGISNVKKHRDRGYAAEQ